MYGRNCSLRCTILLISGSKPSRFGLCGAEVRRQQPGRAGAPGLHDRASARIAERLRAKALHVGPPGVGGFSLLVKPRGALSNAAQAAGARSWRKRLLPHIAHRSGSTGRISFEVLLAGGTA